VSLHENQVRFVNLLLAQSFAGRHYRYTGALYRCALCWRPRGTPAAVGAYADWWCVSSLRIWMAAQNEQQTTRTASSQIEPCTSHTHTPTHTHTHTHGVLTDKK